MRIQCFALAVTILLHAGFAAAQEKPVSTSRGGATPPAAASLALTSERVKKIVTQVASAHTATSNTAAALPAAHVTYQAQSEVAAALGALRFETRGSFDHSECDAFNCTAYDKDDHALYSFPRDQVEVPHNGKDASDHWLACQSRENMLSTFERYDKCRGVNIGLPVTLLSFGLSPQLPL